MATVEGTFIATRDTVHGWSRCRVYRGNAFGRICLRVCLYYDFEHLESSF